MNYFRAQQRRTAAIPEKASVVVGSEIVNPGTTLVNSRNNSCENVVAVDERRVFNRTKSGRYLAGCRRISDVVDLIIAALNLEALLGIAN